MCLDHGHFQLITEGEETSLENIASILFEEGSLVLIDVFGKKQTVSGAVAEIDLMNRRVVLA